MIRAIYRKGAIEPVDEIPFDWQEGQELVVEEVEIRRSADEIEAWAAEVEAATAQISDEDHDQFMAALAEVEAESKEIGRRELERSR